MMARPITVVVLLAFIAVANACKYLKFTPLHSYCQPPNRNCQLLDKGVSSADKALVVKLHNEYRQKVALGKEGQAGGLPSAANMMEMVWDDELAAIAQKHAEQCEFKHDCNKCRAVDRFKVGQNIAIQSTSWNPTETDWAKSMKKFYDEVSMFNKRYITPFVSNKYGHFTQIVWATSSRVGCGRTLYKEGKWFQTLLVCNYGPAGNMKGGEMYKAGRPASACPSGSSSNYQGLCKPN